MGIARYSLIRVGSVTPVIVTVDYLQTPFGVSCAVEFGAGTTAGTIQLAYTLDDLNPDPTNPNLVGWTPVWVNIGAAIAWASANSAVVATFSSNGAQQIAAQTSPFTVPFPGPIRAIRATPTVAPAGGNVLIAVLQGISPYGGK